MENKESNNHRQENKSYNSLMGGREDTPIIDTSRSSLAFPKEVIEFVLGDIEIIIKEFYSSRNKDDQKLLGKLLNNKKNTRLLGELFLQVYLKQMKRGNTRKDMSYIG
jgi:hypothetical protein